MGTKRGNGDWSCPAGMRMPNVNEYNLAQSCVPAGFVTDAYKRGIAWSPSGVFVTTNCGCTWNANWCGQPAIATMWAAGANGAACGDQAQLHICVGSRRRQLGSLGCFPAVLPGGGHCSRDLLGRPQ